VCAEDACTPDSVKASEETVVVISLGPPLPATSLRRWLVPPGRRPSANSVWLRPPPVMSRLAPGGVYPRPRHRGAPCALAARFHPCRHVAVAAVCFCGTFLRVAPTGRYPAPCPMEPGRSSTLARRDDPAPSAHRMLAEKPPPRKRHGHATTGSPTIARSGAARPRCRNARMSRRSISW
jgi:hypothetical protein